MLKPLFPVAEQSIHALYLERGAERSPYAEQRQRLKHLSAQRLAPLQQPSHPIQALDRETRCHLEQVAQDCADLFQRSSSCVEGRNGFLSLYQHGHHRLSPRKQAVLTAIHNFAIKRPKAPRPPSGGRFGAPSVPTDGISTDRPLPSHRSARVRSPRSTVLSADSDGSAAIAPHFVAFAWRYLAFGPLRFREPDQRSRTWAAFSAAPAPRHG